MRNCRGDGCGGDDGPRVIAMDLPTLISNLMDGGCYPGAPRHVELRQTHASAVFLAGDDVYKLKKPVDFGFLDFSTLAKRGRMCRREVQLNRRLAANAYIGVERLLERDGRLHVGGDGKLVDYLVHMRRLPDEANLATMIASGKATRQQMEALAEVIAAFHIVAERSPRITGPGKPGAIRRNVEENFAQVERFAGKAIDRQSFEELRAASMVFLAENEALLRRRTGRGCICDGHGDLRAEHVYFEPDRVSVIDCIEFNDRYRYGDVALDVAFLVMDLERLGAPELARSFLGRYRSLTPWDVDEVLDFYLSYRAFVRTKVALLRAEEAEVGERARAAALGEAREHLALALRFVRKQAAVQQQPAHA